MPIFKTPLHTLIAKSARTDRFAEGCQNMQQLYGTLTSNAASHFATGSTQSSFSPADVDTDAYVPALVTGRTDAERQLPQSFHPIAVHMPAIGQNKSYYLMVGDARPFSRTEGSDFKITSMKDFMLMRVRTLLSVVWANERHKDIHHISPALVQIYSSWIADKLRSNYGLEPQEHVNLRILAGYFYNCLHSNATEVDRSNQRAVAAVLARHLNVSVIEAEAVIEHAGVVEGVEDFVSKARSLLATPRLDKLDKVAFLTIMGGTWYGFGGQDIACCALEHPPTFVSMCYLGFNDRGYKATGLMNTLERFRKNGIEAEVTKGVNRLIAE